MFTKILAINELIYLNEEWVSQLAHNILSIIVSVVACAFILVSRIPYIVSL